MAFGWLYSFGSQKMVTLAAKASTEDLTFLIKLVEDGKLKPVIDRTYPLAETAEAMKYANRGHARGKVVIQINS
jgi:NADPH:quinone reductase-like Zn-dependent oxidoreductase